MTSSIDALQVDEAFLQATQASSANYALFEYIKAIQSSFGIDWPSVKWEDLRMPLYSGLGARLYLEWSVSDVTCLVHVLVYTVQQSLIDVTVVPTL